MVNQKMFSRVVKFLVKSFVRPQMRDKEPEEIREIYEILDLKKKKKKIFPEAQKLNALGTYIVKQWEEAKRTKKKQKRKKKKKYINFGLMFSSFLTNFFFTGNKHGRLGENRTLSHGRGLI